MNDPNWRARAACRDHYELFDPSYSGQPEHQIKHPRYRQAVEICRGCPVWHECRLWALHNYEDSTGVIGGLAGSQLTRLRNHLGIPKPKSAITCPHGAPYVCFQCLHGRAQRSAAA